MYLISNFVLGVAILSMAFAATAIVLVISCEIIKKANQDGKD